MLKEGCSGKAVIRLQQRLVELGLPVGEADGYFGYKTKVAVETLQRLSRLRVDGTVGRRTWRIISNKKPLRMKVHVACPGDTLLHISSTLGTTIEELARTNQLRYRTLKYGPAVVDGQAFYSIEKSFLSLGCGKLGATCMFSGTQSGQCTGAVYDIKTDGQLDLVTGTECLGIPVFRLPGALEFLTRSKVIEEAAKQIRIAVAKSQSREVLLCTPSVSSAMAPRCVALLARIRRELGRNKTIIASLPLNEISGHGRTYIDCSLVAKSADFCLIEGWKESVFAGTPGPLAPTPWVIEAIKRISNWVDPSRIILGISGAAVRHNLTTGVSNPVPYQAVERILGAYCAHPLRGLAENSPIYRCRRRQEELEFAFEDAESIRSKAMSVCRMGLAGLALFDAGWADHKIAGTVAQVFRPGNIVASI